MIKPNTFAAACYDSNSIAELTDALANGPDATDLQTWNIDETEWKAQVEMAIAEMQNDAE